MLKHRGVAWVRLDRLGVRANWLQVLRRRHPRSRTGRRRVQQPISSPGADTPTMCGRPSLGTQTGQHCARVAH